MRRPLLLAGLVAALVVLPATAALAHPAFDPNQLPVGESVDATLVVPHGCSTGDAVAPEEGQAAPTTRLDLQQVEGVRIEPNDVDGWDVSTDGEAISWTAAGGATTDPIELPVTVTIEQGNPGDTILLSAYQECEDGSSYRWTQGSEDTPPLRLGVTAGGTGRAETDLDGTGHGTGGDGNTEEASAADQPTDTPTSEATPSDAATGAATDAGDGGIDGATLAAILAVLVAVTAGIVSLVRRKGAA